ncbi:hypothetical protein [Ancylomarina sp.]|uniref:hypothetical protein n=1 Tax=Ancylomarina sp. TaxID=1970196 RepID=UPI003561972A
MTIEKLRNIEGLDEDKRLLKAYKRMQALIEVLSKREVPVEILNMINSDIQKINNFSGTPIELRKCLRKTYSQTLRLLEKKLGWVIRDHYRNLWLSIGVALGVAFSASFDNNGMGLIVGIAVGITVGMNLDKKAAQSGKQLDLSASSC